MNGLSIKLFALLAIVLLVGIIVFFLVPKSPKATLKQEMAPGEIEKDLIASAANWKDYVDRKYWVTDQTRREIGVTASGMVQLQIEEIKANPDWSNKVRAKAPKYGVTEEKMFVLDALFMLKEERAIEPLLVIN